MLFLKIFLFKYFDYYFNELLFVSSVNSMTTNLICFFFHHGHVLDKLMNFFFFLSVSSICFLYYLFFVWEIFYIFLCTSFLFLLCYVSPSVLWIIFLKYFLHFVQFYTCKWFSFFSNLFFSMHLIFVIFFFFNWKFVRGNSFLSFGWQRNSWNCE